MNTQVLIVSRLASRLATGVEIAPQNATAAMPAVKQQKPQILTIENAKCVSDFREAAKRLLKDNPRSIKHVISEAQKNIWDKPGGQNLLQLLHNMEHKMPFIKPKELDQFLRRALRSANPTTEMPAFQPAHRQRQVVTR